MSEETMEIVRTLLEMFKRRENETPFAFYADDIVWQAAPLQAIGLGGIYEGHEGVRRFWRGWLEAWEDLEFEYEVMARGDEVVALISNQRNLGRGSGLWVDQAPYELVFSFRGNKVAGLKMGPVRGDATSEPSDAR